MGGHFWEASLFKGPKGGYPPKKKFNFFSKINSQRIDRKCQEVSSTSELRFSLNKAAKLLGVLKTPPREL